MFLHLSVHRGGEGWLPSMHHRSHDWGVCIQERGLHWGVCPTPQAVFIIFWRSSVLIENPELPSITGLSKQQICHHCHFYLLGPFHNDFGFYEHLVATTSRFLCTKIIHCIHTNVTASTLLLWAFFIKGFDKAQCIKIHFILKLFWCLATVPYFLT